MRLFAVASPGLEPVCAREASAVPGARAVRAVAGGVELEGDAGVLYAANLELRTASRVLVRLGEVGARDFAALRRGAAGLPWAEVPAAAACTTPAPSPSAWPAP